MKHSEVQVEPAAGRPAAAPQNPQANPWVFKMLIAVIGLCVLGLVAKIFGLL